jgi:hypothetical protein
MTEKLTRTGLRKRKVVLFPCSQLISGDWREVAAISSDEETILWGQSEDKRASKKKSPKTGN